MSLIWNRFRILLVVCLPFVSMLFSGCPGPGASLFGICATQCTDCNPKTVFPNATVTVGKSTHTLFAGGRAEYGCIGLHWDGQKNDPPAFIAKLKADGSYEVFSPGSRTFMADNVVANVSPGVDKLDAYFYVLKVTSEQDALKLDCTNIAKGRESGCWSNNSCLFSWKVTGTTAVGEGGSCGLCRREVCDGKDNDCDGQTDEDGVCGKLFTNLNCGFHKGPTVPPTTPGCNPTGTCACLVTTTQKVYVCGSTTQGKAAWVPLEQAQSGCKKSEDTKTTKNYFCGSEKLLCDSCGAAQGLTPAWRYTSKGCQGGRMVYSK